MSMQMGWMAILAAVVALIGLVVWRVSALAHKGIDAAAGVADGAVAGVAQVIQPVADAAGQAVAGVGHVAHGAGEWLHSVADALRHKQQERVQLAAENAALHAQVEQLKGRRVSATAIERQLQVAFFAIQSKHTSFRRTLEDAGEGGGMLGLERPSSDEFVGVVEADFTAKVGVDLRQLAFELKGDSTVYVHGAHHVEPIGLSDIKLRTLFSEHRRVLHATRLRGGGTEVLTGDDAAQALRHRDDVLAEIQNSSVASALAEVNERVALGFFQALMGAGRYQFIASAQPIEQPLSLEQLCNEINGALSRQIEDLEARRAQALERAAQLDDEILRLALAGREASAG